MTKPSTLSVTSRTASLLLAPSQAYRLPIGLPWTLTAEAHGQVRAGRARSTVLFLDGLEPDTNYAITCADFTLPFRTKTCAGLIDCRDFGVTTNLPDNRDEFAEAIAAVPKGGTLRVEGGRFLTGPLFLKPDMTLLIEDGAEIAAISDRRYWPKLESHDGADRVIGTWEGFPDRCFAAVITAIDCDGLAITGSGTINGGGDGADWWNWPKETRDGARRPRTLHIAYSDGVALTGITVRNSPSWSVHPYRCRDLHVSALEIENPADSPNTDGLNPESCEGVDICGVKFSVGDDCIAIKSGKRGPGENTHLAPCKDLSIRHCLMQFGHGAVVLGSEMSGDIRNVSITNCSFHQTDRGLRLKTRRGRGGVIENVLMQNVEMTEVPTPIAVNAFYFCDADGKDHWIQSRKPATVDETTPKIQNIRIADVTADDVTLVAVAVLGLPEAPIDNFYIERFSVSYDPTALADVPLMALGVEPVRHGGIIAEFAEVSGQLTIRARQEGTTGC